MARVATHGKSLHSAWVVKKKGNGEWVMVTILAVLGFGVIFAVLTALQLSAVK